MKDVCCHWGVFPKHHLPMSFVQVHSSKLLPRQFVSSIIRCPTEPILICARICRWLTLKRFWCQRSFCEGNMMVLPVSPIFWSFLKICQIKINNLQLWKEFLMLASNKKTMKWFMTFWRVFGTVPDQFTDYPCENRLSLLELCILP